MENSEWKDSIWFVLKGFADTEYQERVWWRGQGPESSSFIEATSMLFDSLDLKLFINDWQKVGISLDTRQKLEEFAEQLDRLSDRLPYGKREQIYDAPEWPSITKLASDLVSEVSG